MSSHNAPSPQPTADSPAGPSSADLGPPLAELPPEPRLTLPAPDVSAVVAVASLIADRTRASILSLLADGPCCVCELAAALDERQNNVSMHLARLRDAGLVRAVRHSGDARWIFYERDDKSCAAALACLTDLLK